MKEFLDYLKSNWTNVAHINGKLIFTRDAGATMLQMYQEGWRVRLVGQTEMQPDDTFHTEFELVGRIPQEEIIRRVKALGGTVRIQTGFDDAGQLITKTITVEGLDPVDTIPLTPGEFVARLPMWLAKLESRDMSRELLVIGQRVELGFHWAGSGIVAAIHGEQKPERITQQVGGVLFLSAGGATFDVVFTNGRKHFGVREAELRDGQWKISPHVASPKQLQAALDYAIEKEVEEKHQKEETAKQRAADAVAFAANYPHLLKLTDKPEWSRHRVVAENVRRELKLAFPDFKFSVRADGSAVDVRWTDGPTSKAVESILAHYELGSFNGMEDIYEYDDDRTWTDLYGGVRWVNCHRDDTLQGLRLAWALKGRDPLEIPDNWDEICYQLDDSLKIGVRQAFADTDLRPDQYTAALIAKRAEAQTP